ncbi:MAG: phosphatase, partial [Campylobacterota bacterium]|nr:phosphatase [Campylobacterota bacterium]
MIAIDLGSNTLRVTQLDCQSGIFGASFEKIVKTADGLVQKGAISSEAVRRVIVAISEAKRCIDFSGDKVVAVTTEAIRRASNSEAVLSQIKEETGISFEVISGEKEATLTLLAVEHRLKHLNRQKKDRDPSSFVLIDIGGGSTELIFRYPDQVIVQSFPVGIVTVAQQYKTLEKIDAALPALMKEMKQFAQSVVSRHGALDSFIATAGTPTTVAAMKLGQNYATYDPALINGTSLDVEELD